MEPVPDTTKVAKNLRLDIMGLGKTLLLLFW